MKIDEIELEVIKDYFKGLKRYRGIYYVTLRALVSRRLRQEKVLCYTRTGETYYDSMSYAMIADIVFDDKTKTAETQYQCKNYYPHPRALEHLGDWKSWILSGEYPFSEVYKEREVRMAFGEPVLSYKNTTRLIRFTKKEANEFVESTNRMKYKMLREKQEA